MRARWILPALAILAAMGVAIVGCGGGSSGSTPTETRENLGEFTVGTDATEVETGEITLWFPASSVNANIQIGITKVTETEGEVSYEISGLPDTLYQSVQVKLPLDGLENFDAETSLLQHVLVGACEAPGLDENIDCIELLEGRVEGDYFVADIATDVSKVAAAPSAPPTEVVRSATSIGEVWRKWIIKHKYHQVRTLSDNGLYRLTVNIDDNNPAATQAVFDSLSEAHLRLMLESDFPLDKIAFPIDVSLLEDYKGPEINDDTIARVAYYTGLDGYAIHKSHNSGASSKIHLFLHKELYRKGTSGDARHALQRSAGQLFGVTVVNKVLQNKELSLQFLTAFGMWFDNYLRRDVEPATFIALYGSGMNKHKAFYTHGLRAEFDPDYWKANDDTLSSMGHVGQGMALFFYYLGIAAQNETLIYDTYSKIAAGTSSLTALKESIQFYMDQSLDDAWEEFIVLHFGGSMVSHGWPAAIQSYTYTSTGSTVPEFVRIFEMPLYSAFYLNLTNQGSETSHLNVSVNAPVNLPTTIVLDENNQAVPTLIDANGYTLSVPSQKSYKLIVLATDFYVGATLKITALATDPDNNGNGGDDPLPEQVWKLVDTQVLASSYESIREETCLGEGSDGEIIALAGDSITAHWYSFSQYCGNHFDVQGSISFQTPPATVEPGAQVTLQTSGTQSGYQDCCSLILWFNYYSNAAVITVEPFEYVQLNLNTLPLTQVTYPDDGTTRDGWQGSVSGSATYTVTFPETYVDEFYCVGRGNRGVGYAWVYKLQDR